MPYTAIHDNRLGLHDFVAMCEILAVRNENEWRAHEHAKAEAERKKK